MVGLTKVAIAAVAAASLFLLLCLGPAERSTFRSTQLIWVRQSLETPSLQQQQQQQPPQRSCQDSAAKVYVYDMPPQYNSEPRQRYNCDTEVFMAFVEIWLHEALLNSTALRTLDPDEADFFFVPLYSECFAEGQRQDQKAALAAAKANGTSYKRKSEKDWQEEATLWFESAVKHIWDSHPYFNRTGGRDHLFVFPYGHGPMRFTTWEWHIQQSIFLTPAGPLFSPDVMSWEYARTWKDIMIPLYHKYAHGPGRERRSGRKTFAFFKGALENKRETVHKPQVRDMLTEALKGEPDVYANQAPDKRLQINETAAHRTQEPTYWEYLLDSVFCLAPEGKHPNSCRPFEGMAAGCIPVIIADQFELPFEDFFDWREFSIKVPESDTPDLMRILRGIPQEVIEAKRDAMDRVWRAFQYPTPSRPGDALEYIGLQLARKKRVLKNGAKSFWVSPDMQYEGRQNSSAGNGSHV